MWLYNRSFKFMPIIIIIFVNLTYVKPLRVSHRVRKVHALMVYQNIFSFMKSLVLVSIDANILNQTIKERIKWSSIKHVKLSFDHFYWCSHYKSSCESKNATKTNKEVCYWLLKHIKRLEVHLHGNMIVI